MIAPSNDFPTIKIQKRLTDGYRNIPFLREIFEQSGIRPADIRTYADFLNLPIVRKADIQSRIDHDNGNVMSKTIDKSSLIAEYTTGSTGRPLTVYKSRIERVMAGLRLWKKRKALFPNVLHTPALIVGPSPWAGVSRDRRGIYLSSNDITDDVLRKCLQMVSMQQSTWICGMARVLGDLCQFLERHPTFYPGSIRFAECQSENSSREMRLAMQRQFGCPIANYYGCTEVWTVAYSCPFDELHVENEDLFLEILDEYGQPVQNGEVGEVVITSFVITTLPFIRYRLGDRARWRSTACPCGEQGPCLELMGSRGQQVVIGPNGKKYEAMILYQVMEANVPGKLPSFVSKFKFIQHSLTRFQILVEPGPRYSNVPADFESRIKAWMSHFLGGGLDIEFVVGPIQIGIKHHYFESKMKLESIATVAIVGRDSTRRYGKKSNRLKYSCTSSKIP